MGVFTVDREGVITSVASGEAELTVTLVDNANVVRFQSKYRVAVDYVVKVEEIIVSYNLKEGDEVISLDNGIIEALGTGVAVIEIIANDDSGVSKELTIEVKDASDIDVHFKFTTAQCQSMEGNLVLILMDDPGNMAAILIKQSALLPGEYSKAQIDEI